MPHDAAAPLPTPPVDPWRRLWNRMTQEERRAAVHAYVEQSSTIPEVARSVIVRIGQDTHTRPETVANWTLEQRSDRLLRQGRIVSDDIEQFLPIFFLHRHRALVTRFLDAAQIVHRNGVVDPRIVTAPIPKRDLVEGVLAVRGFASERLVELMLDTMEAQGALLVHMAAARKEAASLHGLPDVEPPRPPPAPSRLSDLEAALARAPTTPPPYGSFGGPRTRYVPVPGETTDRHVAAPEELSVLDRLVTAAAVATASGIEGALPLGDLARLVSELAGLNATRHRSHYHLGFVDVLEGRTPEARHEGTSERHRGWYVCGAAHALARRGDPAAIAQLFDRHPQDVRRILGDRHEACAVGILALLEGMIAGGKRAEALGSLVPSAVSRGGAPVMDRLLAEAVRDLDASRGAEAMPVLTLLEDAIATSRRLEIAVEPELIDQVRLRRAVALRLQGSYDEARAEFERLLPSRDEATAAAARAGLALAACRLRSLAEVRLPPRADDLAATARTLAPAEDILRNLPPARGAAGVAADLCLGTLRLAQGKGDEALPPLERAVAGTWDPAVAIEGYGVAARLRLYLGLALAESLEPGRADESTDLLLNGARSLPEEAHAWLIARALTALAASRPEVAARATQALHATLGDRLLDAALEAGLLPSHEPLREALLLRAGDTHRARRARGVDAEVLLRDALAAADVARAERALEILEDLADDAEGRTRLLGVLGDRARYDPAWGAEEALYARVRLLEAEGRYRDGAILLCAAGHEMLSRDPERGLLDVDGILERIGGYGIDAVDPSLVARRDALRPGVETPVATREPTGRVYFLGGNEVQERYEAWLRSEAARRWPRVAVDFDFTGWSSNWGRELPVLESRIAASDVVVVMRFVRTLLGRSVRRLSGVHGKPWVPCSGHGRASLFAAIERAVMLLPSVRA